MHRFIGGREARTQVGPGAFQLPGIFRAVGPAALAAALILGSLPGTAAGVEPGKATAQPAKAKEATKAKEGAKAKDGAKAKEPADPIAYRVNGVPMRALRIQQYVRSNITMRHAFLIGRSDDIFNEMAARLLDEEILFQEGKRRGLAAEAEKGYVRLVRNAVVSGDYLRRVIRKEVAAAVTDEQVARELPHDARTFVIRQIVVETPEEAEEVRRRLGAGEDFAALAKELSLGVESRKGGLLWDYEAGGAVFSVEQEKYLFALPLNEVSRVLETGLGFAVVRVEEKKEPRPGAVERWRAKIRSRLVEEGVGKRWAEIVAKGTKTALDKEGIYPLVTEWVKSGKPSDQVIGSAAGDSFRFSEIVRAQKRGQDPRLSPLQLTDRITSMMDAASAEAIVAAHARKAGHKISAASEERIGEALRGEVLAMMREREIVKKVSVKDEELRPYFDSHRDAFQVREAREVRLLLSGTRDEAVRLLGEIRAGKDFEALAREHTRDEMSRERGGNVGFLERGVVFKDLEDAIFALREPGDLTAEPVRTAFGWYIAQLISKRVPVTYSFEESRERVAKMIRDEREQAATFAFMNGLRAKTKLEPDEKVLAELRKEFALMMEKRASEPPKKPHHGQ